MPSLDSIAVKVEFATGNVAPLLNEIRHAIQRLIDAGESTAIDVMSLPITPHELASLEETLGDGEVRAELDALGESSIRETAVAGVWIVEHRNGDGELVAKHIEIARVPDILCSQREDIVAGLSRLSRQFAGKSHE
jgi:hydrogenase-1 operon protein HyaF